MVSPFSSFSIGLSIVLYCGSSTGKQTWAILFYSILIQITLLSTLIYSFINCAWTGYWNHPLPGNVEAVNEIEIQDEDAIVMLASEIHQKHDPVPDKRSAFNSSGQLKLAYSLVLDPDSNFRLDWSPDYTSNEVHFQLIGKHLSPQTWMAVGFSDRGLWNNADLCVAWEDWKGFLHVQVQLTKFLKKIII